MYEAIHLYAMCAKKAYPLHFIVSVIYRFVQGIVLSYF